MSSSMSPVRSAGARTPCIRRSVLTLMVAACASATTAPSVAQTYPAKPVSLVVPFVPGGTTDIIARSVAESLGKRLGQPVVVENRGGAGGNIGAAAVAQAKADGYTLLMGYNGTLAINPSLYRQLSWDPVTSFEPLSLVARVNNAVVVNNALPVKTLQELVAYAKAHPGAVNYGSAGPGTIFHLAGEMLEQQTGVSLTHVPYRGAAPALTDLMGGQVQLMFTTLPTVLPHLRAGKLRAIAVTGASRASVLPDSPTAIEAGYPGLVIDSWFAVFAPRGLPPDVQSRLLGALRDVLSDPALVRKLEDQGAQVQKSTPDELAKVLAGDLVRWRLVVKAAQVTLD